MILKGHISLGKTINGHIALGDSPNLNGHISGYRGGGEPYDGPYEVTPKAYDDQTLPTEYKLLNRDITVFKVPKFDVDNPFGGTTVSIATEV